MNNILELVKEWIVNPELGLSYPEGLKQFLLESTNRHYDAYEFIEAILYDDRTALLEVITGIEEL